MEPHSLAGLGLFDLKSLGQLHTATLIQRQNRFVALADLDGSQVRIHVPETGRLQEILTPGRSLLLVKNRPGLKTDYTLVAASMEEGWVLLHSRLHTPIVRRAIEAGLLGFLPKSIEHEVPFQSSRLDLLVDSTTYIEIKGCSLLQNGQCLFPDAPTARGRRHLLELIRARELGFHGIVAILAVRPGSCFAPNKSRDPAFAKTFAKALELGVGFVGFSIKIDQDFTIRYDKRLKLCYNNG